MTTAGTVIIGTGLAGFQTAASLRAEGYLEPITLIGEEPHIPYQRPPLSKGFALGTQDLESLELRPQNFYQNHKINLITSERAVALDPAERRLQLASGSSISYDKLVLAVGARNRLLSIPGAELHGVLYLRSLREALSLKEHLASARNVVVIGGGFIGLELAAVATVLGKSVTVIEALPRLMSRVVAPAISDFFSEFHRSKGVNVLCGTSVAAIAGTNGNTSLVTTEDGRQYDADLVLVGVGVIPNTDLAQTAGLPVSNGIQVNEFLQTQNENIFAIGDCAEHPCVFTEARIRLESVQNAADQAHRVAATIAGHRESYRALPWFWTDQFDVKLQMAGISHGHDQVVTRGSREANKLSVFYFKRDRLIAVDSINRPLDHMIGRKLIAAGTAVTPLQAADDSFDLKTLAQRPKST